MWCRVRMLVARLLQRSDVRYDIHSRLFVDFAEYINKVVSRELPDVFSSLAGRVWACKKDYIPEMTLKALYRKVYCTYPTIIKLV